MTSFTFIPSAPKQAKSATLKELKAAITPENRIDGAKRVGNLTVKVYMTGPVNYYTKENQGLLSLLGKHRIEIY